jgi:predicted acyl esterase
VDETTSPYLFRSPRSTPGSRGGRPPAHRFENRPGMVIEKDVAVPYGDEGHVVYVDVYRPEGDVPAAPLVSWSPYGKHNPAPIGQIYPNSGVRPEWTSDLTTFEAPDPEYWVPHGYAIVLVDVPGTWYSEGRATYHSPEEARAFADLVEWAGTQPWSAGKVGLSGVSYLSSLQWFVAALNPPHLAAINPWEGWNDTYREVARHGGIPETSFWPYIWERWGASTTEIEDLEAETAAHPWFDEFWASKAADLEAIQVPAFVVASWADQGLHTRGTLEGFRRAGSAQKWLDVHGRKKWAYYYEPENVERQRAFFDHFLLGTGPGVDSWPRVRAEVRERCYEGTWREAEQWPLEDVGYRPTPFPSRWSWSATCAPCCTCPPSRPRTWTCSSRCSSSTPPASRSGSPTTGSSRTARWRSAGCARRTASWTRSGRPTSCRCWPTGGRCR